MTTEVKVKTIRWAVPRNQILPLDDIHNHNPLTLPPHIKAILPLRRQTSIKMADIQPHPQPSHHRSLDQTRACRGTVAMPTAMAECRLHIKTRTLAVQVKIRTEIKTAL